MNQPHSASGGKLEDLQERAKELSCLYSIDEILRDSSRSFEEALTALAAAIPSGWRYPHLCRAVITLRERSYRTGGLRETDWKQTAPIVVRGEMLGQVLVWYEQPVASADEGPFLKEERKLLESIAERIAQAWTARESDRARNLVDASGTGRHDWRVILELLQMTDPDLHRKITRKMLNHLAYNGIPEAKRLLEKLSMDWIDEAQGTGLDENRPRPRAEARESNIDSEIVFRITAENLEEAKILSLVQLWIKEDRVNFLVQVLERADSSLLEIASAVGRYQNTGVNAHELSIATQSGLKTSLVRRILTDHLDFIDTARKYLEIEDFFDLLSRTILVSKSHGKLGGKSSGVFLAAEIIHRCVKDSEILSGFRVPKTWYLPSDVLLHFLAHNHLDDVYNWKYQDLEQIRREYPHLIHVFKNSRFSADILQGLSRALDDFGTTPLIVRSSSLLEDRTGSAFSGKYKSLFLANQGDKTSRLNALTDAIAEVYSSVFSPDPIQYRAERHLLDHHEEMAIMIQEVVGERIGRYFLPAFSGVAFSQNDFRWSPRIRRDDNLLRLVPGLGTRAVDRVADDYPVLVAPGQPGLRVNASPDEAIHYAPKKIDVINLEENAFETLDIKDLLGEIGNRYPALHQLVSVYEDHRLRLPGTMDLHSNLRNLVVTFEGLISRTPFLAQIRRLLTILQETLRNPVDIEFASDGKFFYLLQCRSQSHLATQGPAPIPRDIPAERILFSANRHVSNGRGPDFTHVVYVDPLGYAQLSDLKQLQDVGRAVGRLNKMLPRRQFILMGPGRWGSRGDIRLGVSVTYSDICNTGMLIEIARKQGNYALDLSFGTHFFQDLVESDIRYLPLYPDEGNAVFREDFFRNAPNLLPALLPQYKHLASALRVIDIPASTENLVLRVLMNADLEEAVGILTKPGAD